MNIGQWCGKKGLSRFRFTLAAVGAFVLLVLAPFVYGQVTAAEIPGLETRQSWATSRIIGSPEPQAPYRLVRAFENLSFKQPVVLTSAPDADRLFLAEQQGKIYSFTSDPESRNADLFFDVRTLYPRLAAVYGLTFHPNFKNNRYCYICYVLGGSDPDGTRVSRFTVSSTEPPRIVAESEKRLISWRAGGHNGGCLKFGPDGYLYIATGDAASPNPPDALDTGQDISDLLSSILRIDVGRPSGRLPYGIPADNPFVDLDGARGEVWAYGFRNPWKMSFDRQTGELWTGDVGWELWEMVYRVDRGGNYGWSVQEGRQSVRPESKRGPTPIQPPIIDHPHSEAASVTGGFVYRGKRHPELVGAYVYGDYDTRRMWSFRYQNGQVSEHRELVPIANHVVAFGETNEGELYIVNYDGTLHELAVNKPTDAAHEFPQQLSETGLFASTADHQPAPGVYPFSPRVAKWADHARSRRLVAIPNGKSVSFEGDNRRFPKDSVLAKTLFFEGGAGESETRLETQILHFNGTDWRGYSYLWNEQQTDARLVDGAGADVVVSVADPNMPGGRRQLTWHVAGRSQCTMCHNRWAGYQLAFNADQLDFDNQLRSLEHAGVINFANRRRPDSKGPNTLVDPHDTTADLDARARSYLHVNCAHCHRFGGGGTALIDLRRELSLDKTLSLGVRPSQGTFGIHDAHIVAPGNPYRSAMLYRLAKIGRGRMPHIGSEVVDRRGVELLHDWIGGLKSSDAGDGLRVKEAAAVETLVDSDFATDSWQKKFDQLSLSTSGVLRVVRAIDEGRFASKERDKIVTRGAAHQEARVRDLFEAYLPEQKRSQRLGAVVNLAEIMARQGDVAQGRELFFRSPDVQCRNCHQLAGQGTNLGPDLSEIGKRFNRRQLLESILEPSKLIDPKYVTYLAETTDGRVFTGLITERTESHVTLSDAQNRQTRLATDEIETLVPSQRSLMPDLQLRDMTAEQVADLLAFLSSLK